MFTRRTARAVQRREVLSQRRPLSGGQRPCSIKATAADVLAGKGPAPAARAGSTTNRNLLSAFADHVVSFIDAASMRPLHVVADTANGMGGLVVPAVMERLPKVTLEVMYGELDGTFPNHPADPLQPANQRTCRRVVSAVSMSVWRSTAMRRGSWSTRPAGASVVPRRRRCWLRRCCVHTSDGVAQPDLFESRPGGDPENGGVPVRTRSVTPSSRRSWPRPGLSSVGALGALLLPRQHGADLIASLLVLNEIAGPTRSCRWCAKLFERYSSSGEINTHV
jgi:phosphomannomutase